MDQGGDDAGKIDNLRISRAEARSIGDERSICMLEVAVRDVGELTLLIRNIRKINGVESVERLAG